MFQTKLNTKWILMALLGALNTGCTDSTSLNAELTGEPKQDVRVLAFSNPTMTLAKKATATQLVRARTGGTVTLAIPGNSKNSATTLEAQLMIPPHSLPRDTEITVSSEGQYLDFTFSPGGTRFNPPALLQIDAHGVDLNNVHSEAVSLFYRNEEDGSWEPMKVDFLLLEEGASRVKVSNAQISHFSRYVLAEE